MKSKFEFKHITLCALLQMREKEGALILILCTKIFCSDCDRDFNFNNEFSKQRSIFALTRMLTRKTRCNFKPIAPWQRCC
jgi:hypothetical protein